MRCVPLLLPRNPPRATHTTAANLPASRAQADEEGDPKPPVYLPGEAEARSLELAVRAPASKCEVMT